MKSAERVYPHRGKRRTIVLRLFAGVVYQVVGLSLRSSTFSLSPQILNPTYQRRLPDISVNRYRLIANPGTRINLHEGASIVSFSPVRFEGTKSAPVVIQSDHDTGQGLMVISAGSASLIRNAVITDRGALTKGSWKLTGVVTFYESDVEIGGTSAYIS